MSEGVARRAAEAAARQSYGRLVALLASRSRDIAAAEDALAEAFMAALSHWPQQGVPDNPDAWLLTAARNVQKNAVRHQVLADAVHADLLLVADEATPDMDALPDERLKLLFVCAHPAIAVGIRTPLMLQTVLGLDAAQIGAAFLVPDTTMGQRLVRAKGKIRDAGLRFELPTMHDMPERLGHVLEAIYAAYGSSWDQVAGADGAAPPLVSEALFLGRLLVELMPEEPEPRGLLALMLYCESRRRARRAADGGFIPLDRQDNTLWSRDMIVEAEGLLTVASRAGRFGRFQCEAAIQSVHAQRPVTGKLNHEALTALYELLAQRCPSVGATVGHAAALLDAGRPADALERLKSLAESDLAGYQPYWVVRARALKRQGLDEEAEQALRTAVALTSDPAIVGFLLSEGVASSDG